jgi:hypothetical protein
MTSWKMDEFNYNSTGLSVKIAEESFTFPMFIFNAIKGFSQEGGLGDLKVGKPPSNSPRTSCFPWLLHSRESRELHILFHSHGGFYGAEIARSL